MESPEEINPRTRGKITLQPPLLTLFIILGISILLLLTERLRPDLIALLVAVSLGITGILTPQETFSGFSRSAVITIMAIFVLAEGLQRTGVTDQVGNFLLRAAGSKESWLIIIVMLAGAVLSLFMNNIAAASVLLPAVMGAAQKSKISPARLLMPLAFGTILGGMATLLTTTNIIVSSLLRDRGMPGYGLLDFAPLGIPLVLAGTAYMIVLGRRLLPSGTTKSLQASRNGTRPINPDLVGVYQLEERLIRARLPANSPLVGKPLSQSQLREEHNLNAVGIQRHGHWITPLLPETVFRPEDILLLEGVPDELPAEKLAPVLEFLPPDTKVRGEFGQRDNVVVEAVLAPRSDLIGSTLKEVFFREKYHMQVLAIWRAGKPIRTRLTDLTLQFGDALLLQGPAARLSVLQSDPDLMVLSHHQPKATSLKGKAWFTLAIFVVTLFLAAAGWLPITEAMMGGALAMVLLGVLTMDQAYGAIEWRSIFMIAGMLPLGVAMTKTGAADFLSLGLVDMLAGEGPLAIVAGLVVLSTLLTQTMNGAAVAAVVTPVAVEAAMRTGSDPQAFAMAVALATSIAFLTPLGHPVNILVMGPGEYRFKDFARVGLPLTVLLIALILVLLPVTWPFTP